MRVRNLPFFFLIETKSNSRVENCGKIISKQIFFSWFVSFWFFLNAYCLSSSTELHFTSLRYSSFFCFFFLLFVSKLYLAVTRCYFSLLLSLIISYLLDRGVGDGNVRQRCNKIFLDHYSIVLKFEMLFMCLKFVLVLPAVPVPMSLSACVCVFERSNVVCNVHGMSKRYTDTSCDQVHGYFTFGNGNGNEKRYQTQDKNIYWMRHGHRSLYCIVWYCIQ